MSTETKKPPRTVDQALDELIQLYEKNQGKPPGYNLTQRILASIVDVTVVTMNHWLQKKHANIHLRQFQNLCNFLDKSKNNAWLTKMILKGSK